MHVINDSKYSERTVVKIYSPGHGFILLPVFILTNWSWPKYCCVGFAWKRQVLFTFAQLILRITAIISKVLRMNLTNNERVTWSTIFHYVTFGRVELHCVFEPYDLKMETVENRFLFLQFSFRIFIQKWDNFSSEPNVTWQPFLDHSTLAIRFISKKKKEETLMHI